MSDRHEASMIMLWHSRNGEHYDQIDYIMVKELVWPHVNTRAIP